MLDVAHFSSSFCKVLPWLRRLAGETKEEKESGSVEWIWRRHRWTLYTSSTRASRWRKFQGRNFVLPDTMEPSRPTGLDDKVRTVWNGTIAVEACSGISEQRTRYPKRYRNDTPNDTSVSVLPDIHLLELPCLCFCCHCYRLFVLAVSCAGAWVGLWWFWWLWC